MFKIFKSVFFLLISFQFILLTNKNVKAFYAGKDIPNSEYKYILIQEKEYLAVYKINDFNCPIYMVPFDISMLGEADKQDLIKGILIKDTTELRDRLEDFTG